MATEEPSKSEFESILTCMNRKFVIFSTKWSDEKNFEAKFRTQVPRENEDYNTLCDEWVDQFSAVTSTTWVKKISNTGPQIRFRKQYQCWTLPGEVRKELLFDPRRCKATLDVKVLTDNDQTRRKNKFIRQGLNAFVKLNFTHLHLTDKSKSFAYFVHNCKSQPEAPRMQGTSCENIPEIIQNIVSKVRSRCENKVPIQHTKMQKIEEVGLHDQNIQYQNCKFQAEQQQFAENVSDFHEMAMYQPSLMLESVQTTQMSPFSCNLVPAQGIQLTPQNESINF